MATKVKLINEKTPLISIDVCSDENIKQSAATADNDVIVNYPGVKRHSTGDASQVEGFSSALLGQQCLNQPRSSTVSLFDPKTGSKSRSRTAITDF